MLWDIIYYIVLVTLIMIIAVAAYKEGWDDGYEAGMASKEDHNDR